MRLALIAALLVACGDDAATKKDAGPDGDGGNGDGGDAMIDADPNVRGTVTVRIVDKNGAALAGMYVVFIDTDATVTEKMTDAAGMVTADVYPNASVTAIRTRGMSVAIVTVQALNPGDAITLVSAASTVSSSEDPFSQRVVPLAGADIAASPNGASKSGSVGTFTTVAPHGLVAGDHVIVSNVGVSGYDGVWTVASAPSATTFTVSMGSGGLANSGTLAVGATAMKAILFTVNYSAYPTIDHYEVHTRCGTTNVGNVTSAVLALPVACVTSPMDITVAAKLSSGVTLMWTQQANVTIAAGGSTTITDAWQAVVQVGATYTNPTAQVTNIVFARFSPYVRGFVDVEKMSPVGSTTLVEVSAPLPPAAANVTSLTCPMGTGSGCIAASNGFAAQRITELVDGTLSTYALDIGATLLPWLKASFNGSTGTLDVEVTGMAPFDIFEGNIRYVRGQMIYTWRVFGPLAQSVKFPTLPATAPGNPTLVTGEIASIWQAFVGESDAVNGYRDAIKNPFEALGTCDASSNPNVKPYAGAKNRISQWN